LALEAALRELLRPRLKHTQPLHLPFLISEIATKLTHCQEGDR